MSARLEYFAFRLIKGIAQGMPLKSTQRAGAALGSIAYATMSKRRAIAPDNLRHAFPEKTETERVGIARRSFENFGIAMFELLYSPKLSREEMLRVVRIENLDLLRSAYNKGKGIIALSGHFGSWELNAMAAAAAGGYPVSVIVQSQVNELVDEEINRLRGTTGIKVIPMGVSVREVMRALSRGEIVGILPDQSGPEDGLYAKFFGRDASAHQGPAVFALRTGAPMIYSFNARQPDGTYRSFFVEVKTDDLDGATEDNINELTRRHTKILEDYIRQYPDHWQWMHRRWKHLRPVSAAVNPSHAA
ncbi:MAG TPA: lysophospholipid acyltransferase family protein [Bacteroidota bacterium]|nr:lysophospholipid acyltransferase family protein [Bacteroidota bacterium]